MRLHREHCIPTRSAAIVDKTWGELHGHPIHITATPSSKKYTIRIEFDGSSVQLALANESTAEKDLNHFFSEEYEIGDVHSIDSYCHSGRPKDDCSRVRAGHLARPSRI